jgi:hypothetical protein
VARGNKASAARKAGLCGPADDSTGRRAHARVPRPSGRTHVAVVQQLGAAFRLAERQIAVRAREGAAAARQAARNVAVAFEIFAPRLAPETVGDLATDLYRAEAHGALGELGRG